ncbi:MULTISPECIES: GvpL/GvpF family gas vesicle protein [Bacillaceae]|uniref:GvpL/GvpF family gas vesicle protein n=1 Tax=Metabacillus sediminis TaxID=3117746 RepID=A0ABZ2NFX2_9BACI|nr:GvpL/GvpF family gas vesicle protein [Bacillus sp. SJS]KZZ83312.1 gas vesicle protein GvpL [Bacillus sp. SJS]
MSKLIYLYGLVPTEEAAAAAVPSFKGFDQEHDGYSIEFGSVTAVICELDPAEYSEEQIKEKVNEMEWLHEKAFHHHEMLMMLEKSYTLIPTKFCTIYSSLESLTETVNQYQERMLELFRYLEGKEEWNVKIYSDDSQMRESFAENNPTVLAKKEEIAQLPPGRQYFEKRKLEQLVDREMELEKNRICEQIHEDLVPYSDDSTIKKTWSQDVTGRDEQMCWNSVYLLPKDQIAQFKEKIQLAAEAHQESGWKFEPTGPWPPYHFANLLAGEERKHGSAPAN